MLVKQAVDIIGGCLNVYMIIEITAASEEYVLIMVDPRSV